MGKNACSYAKSEHNDYVIDSSFWTRALGKGDSYITACTESILVVVKFRIGGNLRFLSHAETVRVFHRACVRGGIKIAHSAGFSSRPKLSLPLPRTVGVESEADLLCLYVPALQCSDEGPATSQLHFDCEAFAAALGCQLPDGCQLVSVETAERNTPFHPVSATYVLPVRQEYLSSKLRARIEDFLASGTFNLTRRTDAKGNTRSVDVRRFLKSIELDEGVVVVECRISSAGSIRVEEILRILGLDLQMLAGPISRSAVQWEQA